MLFILFAAPTSNKERTNAGTKRVPPSLWYHKGGWSYHYVPCQACLVGHHPWNAHHGLICFAFCYFLQRGFSRSYVTSTRKSSKKSKTMLPNVHAHRLHRRRSTPPHSFVCILTLVCVSSSLLLYTVPVYCILFTWPLLHFISYCTS
jgi:hypothetical protein